MDFFDVVKERFSTRDFTEKEISKDDLEKIIAASCQAPVGMGAYDKYHLTLLKGDALKELRKELEKKAGKDVLYGAPYFVILSAKEQDSYQIEFCDAGEIIGTMLYASRALGVDSCYIYGASTMIRKDENLRKLAQIPEGFLPLSGAILGYGKEKKEAKDLKISLPINTAE